jgi:putative ABC transport system permease protein
MFFHWLSQVASITKFGLLSIPRRLGSVCAVVVGITGVVTVFAGVLSIAAGFRQVMKSSASPDSAIVLRSGANSEMVSGFLRETTRLIGDAPGVLQGSNGPLSSAELFVIIDVPKRSTGTDANVPLRGVEPAAFQVRNIKIVQGKMFDWGKNEVVVGSGAAKEFAGLEVGNEIKLGRLQWKVTGIFDAAGGMPESEIWTDATVLQDAYHRGDTFQAVYTTLNSPDAFITFSNFVATDPRLTAKSMRQGEYYAEQSAGMTRLITSLGVIIALLMALGAVFVALNTMFSAVATRTREIATLRALGFGRGSVVVAVMLESLIFALIGGVLGGVIAYVAFNDFHTATMNFQTFSQITFAFKVTPRLLIEGIAWAVAIGLIGGLFPAVRAARLPIAAALREL